jgi:HK97 family phage major capsid protein
MSQYSSTGLGAAAEQAAAKLNKGQRPPVQGAPNIIPGGMTSDSETFSLSRLLRKGSEAKLENKICEDFGALLKSSGLYLATADQGGRWVPNNLGLFDEAMMTDTTKKEHMFRLVKGVMQESAKVQGDPDELAAMRRSILKKAGAYTGQSAFIDNTGGTLVAPPPQGDVIPLIRPQAAAIAAGASEVTLPPSGRMVRPRITSAPDVVAVGEGQDPPISSMNTGELTLTAKKMVGYVVISEESTLFTQGTQDTYVRQELGRSLGLKQDAYVFYGVGGNLIPAGLTSAQYSSEIIDFATAYPTARGVGTNGNILRPEYGDYIPALVDDRSFGQDGSSGCWVMRPTAYAAALGVRADAVAVGDQNGVLVDLMRKFQADSPGMFRGRKVVQSTNLRNNATKGSGTGLTDVFYGVWQYCLIATYGAIQIQDGTINAQFIEGLKTIKATQYGDVGFLYPGAFCWYKQVVGLNSTNM